MLYYMQLGCRHTYHSERFVKLRLKQALTNRRPSITHLVACLNVSTFGTVFLLSPLNNTILGALSLGGLGFWVKQARSNEGVLERLLYLGERSNIHFYHFVTGTLLGAAPVHMLSVNANAL